MPPPALPVADPMNGSICWAPLNFPINATSLCTLYVQYLIINLKIFYIAASLPPPPHGRKSGYGPGQSYTCTDLTCKTSVDTCTLKCKLKDLLWTNKNLWIVLQPVDQKPIWLLIYNHLCCLANSTILLSATYVLLYSEQVLYSLIKVPQLLVSSKNRRNLLLPDIRTS